MMKLPLKSIILSKGCICMIYEIEIHDVAIKVFIYS